MEDLKTFITNQEGIAYTAYRDASGYSIGVGHFLAKGELISGELLIGTNRVKWKQGLIKPEIDALLQQDIDMVQAQIKAIVKVKLNPCQFNALTSFVFNLGIGSLQSSTLLKDINAGDLGDVPGQLALWVHSSGTVNQGLVNRRKLEAEMWLTEDCNGTVG
jgi:lysozyme